MSSSRPRGRFAPSPTGPLHFGSLVAAIGSYLNVKSREGEWLVRMEDLDPPREQVGITDTILRTLEAYALPWDGTVVYQSQRSELYEAAIDQLHDLDLVYFCHCSRRDIERVALPGIEGYRYPGTCSQLGLGPRDNSLRIRVPDKEFHLTDLVQGDLQQNLQTAVGDFILRRRDGFYSYQLAVVVDDADQEITEVCRGADLIDSTARQVYLQSVLGMESPTYLHLPIAVNEQGQKLSKQTFAEPVRESGDGETVFAALRFLGQEVPGELAGAPPAELLQWGVEYWDLESVPRVMQIRSSR